MNHTYNVHNPSSAIGHALQDRFGLKVSARLQEGSHDLPYDIAERLRASREQALAQRKRGVMVAAPVRASVLAPTGGGTLSLGGDDQLGWFGRLGAGLALMLLVAGLVTIDVVQDDERAREIADVDTALLIDDVPPAAYADPGFVQFLKYGLPEH